MASKTSIFKCEECKNQYNKKSMKYYCRQCNNIFCLNCVSDVKDICFKEKGKKFIFCRMCRGANNNSDNDEIISYCDECNNKCDPEFINYCMNCDKKICYKCAYELKYLIHYKENGKNFIICDNCEDSKICNCDICNYDRCNF
jgi:hypothetical protein